MKKVCVVTGSRAEYGLLRWVMEGIRQSPKLKLQTIVTGMHLSSKFGHTANVIESDGFKIDYKVKIPLKSDTSEATLKSMGIGMNGFANALAQLKPDMLLVLGDRYEIFIACIAAMITKIPISHLHGGESTEGMVDEAIRHSISKMSHLHLVSNQDAKQRLTQLGELEKSIYVLGSPDLDLMNSKKLPLLNKVKKYYEINFEDYAIAMFHPVTTEYGSVRKQIKIFIDSLIESDENYILIYPNNDIGSNEILEEYQRLSGNKKFKIYPSLKFEYFLTLLKNASFIIGNSSAGIREAPYYKTPTIDVGTRQRDRSSGKSIFHSSYDVSSILKALEEAKNSKINNIIPAFGTGNSDEMLLKILDDNSFWDTERQKVFQDLDWKN